MRELLAQHLFLNAKINVDIESLTHNMRAIIDCDITYNFINQLKIKKHSFLEMYKEIVSLTILSDISLKTQNSHNKRVNVVDSLNQEKKSDHSFLRADMNDIRVVVELGFGQKFPPNP
jgi:hypothetical protein